MIDADGGRFLGAERAVIPQDLFERLAVNEFCPDAEPPLVLAGAVDRDHVRVAHARQQPALVVLSDQGLLLVLSEEGELALVRATPDQFTEVAGFPALEGKTWNHPVLVGDILLVRNGQEIAALRLLRANH